MSSINIDIKGLDAALRDLKLLDKQAKDNCQKALNIYAIDVHRDAVNLAPVDEGHLRGSIQPKFGELEASVTVATDYAAYIEFRTRKYAAAYVAGLPQDWKELAAQYRGKAGGSFKELVERLRRWCRVKGLGENAAYMVAKKIMIDGIKPQPYLYPAAEQNKKKLIDNLKKLFS